MQHRSKQVKEFLRSSSKGVKTVKGSPYLNAMEECWHRGKHALLVSEYYKTFSDMCGAISAYYRTARFNLELSRYANRTADQICNDL